MNSQGPGSRREPNLDGVPSEHASKGPSSFKNIENEDKTVYPDIYNYSYESMRSYVFLDLRVVPFTKVCGE